MRDLDVVLLYLRMLVFEQKRFVRSSTIDTNYLFNNVFGINFSEISNYFLQNFFSNLTKLRELSYIFPLGIIFSVDTKTLN